MGSAARFAVNWGVAGGNSEDRLPTQRSVRQRELIENSVAKQKLAMKVPSRLRVICATHLPKTAVVQRSERFLCCVCSDLR
jgi:hypothetical protein